MHYLIAVERRMRKTTSPETHGALLATRNLQNHKIPTN